MKNKIYLVILSLVAFFVSSCSNDPIEVRSGHTVEVTVNLNNFFSSYNFNDTKHDIKLGDDYRVFHSEYDKYIQVRVLFYNKETGNLVDSVLIYSENTNAQRTCVSLPAGEYYAISTLAFADEESIDVAWWDIAGKEKLATVKMIPKLRWSKWSILSVETKQFSVVENGAAVTLTPAPVGAMGYYFFQNFQYKDEESYGTKGDNGIRYLTLYSQKIAKAYYLDPNASDRYEYYSDAGRDSWYFLSRHMSPQNYDKEWTYFRTNLYGYFYMLAPEFNLCFGYVLDGQDSFSGYGHQNTSIEYGKTYLAYWDYFQVGNPYFGIADNNHWNDYSSNSAKGVRNSMLFVDK